MAAVLDLFSRPPGLVRRAKYAPEFLEAMRGRIFQNPKTRQENQFGSLPDEEKQRIHDQWMRSRQEQPEPKAKPRRQIPEEALKATTLTPNKDPNRYKGVEVEYGSLGEDSDEIRQELHDILGDAAKKAGMTPEQLALDLAGGGGVSGLKAVKLMTLKNGNRSAVMVTAEGDDIVEMDREMFFLDGQLGSIRNKHLELNDAAPKGMGTRMLATQVASMKEVAPDSHLKTVGAGNFDSDYVGYYVWPLLGFDGDIPENEVSQMPKWLIEELEDTSSSSEPGDPFRISELMSFPEGRKYWLKEGAEIELEFPVKNDAVLQRYVDLKAQGAGKTVGQFLHNASKKTRDKTKGSDKVERAPQLDKADFQILSKIWDSLPKKRSKKDKTMTTKNATRALIDLAKKDSSFRTALLSEVVKEGNININIRDFAMDEFSQHQMLRNLRAGDLIEILYEPNELHPQQIATRLVDSDFDSEIPGVLLQGTNPQQEMLADRGQGMPLVWESGSGLGFPVLKLKLVHSKLAAEAEEKIDNATAAQVQFALDLSEEKGKNHTKSELAKKTKAEISSLIEKMQGEKTVASSKQVSYAHSLLEQAGRKSPSKSSLEKMSETEISKLIDRLKRGSDKKAHEILEALGGRRKLESMLGARDLKLYKNELLFSWPNRTASKGTQCGISMMEDEPGQCEILFMAKDASGALHVVGQYKVAKDALVPTFEKHTGWFLRV